MTYKVKQYINQDRFLRERYSVMKCYEDFSQQKEDFFTEDEQKEIFEYFWNKRKENVLFSFSFWNRNTLINTSSFSLIKPMILGNLSSKLDSLLKQDNLSIQECFDLLDYTYSLIGELDKDSISNNFNQAIIQFKKLTQHNENLTDNLVNSSLDIFAKILVKSQMEMPEELIVQLVSLKQGLDKKYFSHLRSMYNSILTDIKRSEFIDVKYKEMVIFSLNSHNIFDKKFMLYIINRIVDLDFLNILLKEFFPKKQENLYNLRELFDQTLLIVNRLYILEVSSIDILDKYLGKEKKEILLKFIGGVYQYHMDQEIIFDISSQKINFNYLKQPLKDYVWELSQDHNFEMNRGNMFQWGLSIFTSLIDTKEKFSLCSNSAKNLRLELVQGTRSPLFHLLPQERQTQIRKGEEHSKQLEECKEKQKNVRIECIKLFFDKDKGRLISDIEDVKKYFGEPIVTFEQIYHYQQDVHYSIYDDEPLEKKLIILNPFLISYMYDMYFFLNPDKDKRVNGATINIDEVFNELLYNWDQYRALHLYNYLIHIKKFDYEFNEEEKVFIVEYFKNLQKDNTVPLYIFYHIHKVFGFHISLCEDTVLNLLGVHYYFLEHIQKLHIWDKLHWNYPPFGIVLGDDEESERMDFTDLFQTNNIVVYDIFEKLTNLVNISHTWNYTNLSYYQLLSICNIYLQFSEEKQKEFRHNIISLCEKYFESTLLNADKNSWLSPLVKHMIELLDIENNILEQVQIQKQIHENHLAYVTRIQFEKYKTTEWDSVKDFIYDIRQGIRSDSIKLISYNHSREEFSFSHNGLEVKYQIQESLQQEKLPYEDMQKLNENLDKLHTETQQYIDSTDEKSKLLNKIYILTFFHKDITIWEDYIKLIMKSDKYAIQDIGLPYIEYVIRNFRIQDQYMEKFVTPIVNNYNIVPDIIDRPSGVVYSPNLEPKIILDRVIDCIIETNFYYTTDMYDKLLEIKRLNPDQRDRLITKRNSKLEFVTIVKQEEVFKIIGKDELFNNASVLAEYYTKQYDITDNVSQIKPIEYLIEDIKQSSLTMSHPYCFEDPIENQYPIDDLLYITCWSFTTGRENGYAWWKLYGKNTKSFRSIVPIRKLLISVLSVLDIYTNSELYVGSVDYDSLGDIDDNYKHESVEDFLKKREDFRFEKEFRVMVKIHPKDKDKVNFIGVLEERCSLKLSDISLYKNIDLDEENKNLKFNPFDKQMGKKDKQAILTVLKNKINKL